jgi:methionyl-tRNA synthetase
LDPSDPVAFREQEILVLPMEDYRDRLTTYYAARQATWRPHARQLVAELLAKPLPDAPVTIPGTWGIPAPFAPTPGQILYPWVEAMPASMYSTWWAASAQGGEPDTPVDEHWLAGRAGQIVYFHGFDNVYHWGLMDLVLLMAHGGRYALPDANVCNEFYDLDGEKFSTSRNHLIWSVDLLVKVPRDLVRFYLALTAPEFQRSDFSRERLERVTSQRLVAPWNALADALDRAVEGALVRAPGGAGGTAARSVTLPTTPDGRARAGTMLARMRAGYELETFSLTRTAEAIANQLDRLRRQAQRLHPTSQPAGGDQDGLGDLLLQVRTLLSLAAPILIDVAEQAFTAGLDLSLADPVGPAAATVQTFRLPRLPNLTEPDVDAGRA